MANEQQDKPLELTRENVCRISSKLDAGSKPLTSKELWLVKELCDEYPVWKETADERAHREAKCLAQEQENQRLRLHMNILIRTIEIFLPPR